MKFGRILGPTALAFALLFANTATRAATIVIPPPPVGGGSVSLASLVGNVGVVGDKSFSFLSAVISGNTSVTTAQVAVTSLTIGTGGLPVQPFGFQLNAPLITTSGTGDLSLSYIVTTSGPLINSAELFASVASTGTGQAQVNETVFVNNNGTPGAQLGFLSATTTNGSVGIFFAPQTSVFVIKDIVFNANANGTAAVSVVGQTFNQLVPEPTSVVMAGMGFLGTLGFGLRRKFRVTA